MYRKSGHNLGVTGSQLEKSPVSCLISAVDDILMGIWISDLKVDSAHDQCWRRALLGWNAIHFACEAANLGGTHF